MNELQAKFNQTIQGKAYEYACLIAVSNVAEKARPIQIVQNSSFLVAFNAWNALTDEVRTNMRLSAQAGTESLLKMEPRITEDGNDLLELSLQEDKRGQEGDVRDIVVIRRDIEWEIGISVKHNHSAVKHSRLSPTIDFGKEWFGLACSKNYFEQINPVFDRLKELALSHINWNELTDKNSTVYVPLLLAFKEELVRLDHGQPGIVPGRLLEYLLGRKDFYKLISDDAKKFTTLQCFNLHGTLNLASKTQTPILKARGVGMPSTIYHFDFKQKSGVISETTLQLVMDNDWGISFRIHNASTKVEPSLKFDIQLTGTPSNMFSNTVGW